MGVVIRNVVAVNNLNFEIRDLSILRHIEDYEKFYEKCMNIKQMFKFESKVILDIIDSLDEMSKVLNTYIPSWVIGISFDNIILILNREKWEKSNKESFDKLILHEFVHVVLNLKTSGQVPMWLNEALAVYLSGQYKSYKNTRIGIGRDFDFYSLDYNSNNLYNISIFALLSLIREYGEENIIKEVIECNNFMNSNIFNNKNLIDIVGIV